MNITLLNADGMMNWIIFLAIFMATPVHSASFDCNKAISTIEKTICSDEELSSLDESLTKAYSTAQRTTSSLTGSQRHWLKHRNTCQNRDCLVAAYQYRISELSRKENEECKICIQLNQLVQSEGIQSLRGMNNEQVLGELCGYSMGSGYKVDCKDSSHPFDIERLKRMGIEINDEERLRGFMDYGSRISVSTVDVNNDGLPDLRFQTSQGNLSCDKNLYFFRTSDNKYRNAKGSAIEDSLEGEGANFCDTDAVVSLKRDKVTYTVLLEVRANSAGAVYRGMPDGSFVKLSDLSLAPKPDEETNGRGVNEKAIQADEEILLKKSIAAIAEADKPNKLAIWDETLSKEDILRKKVPRHNPEYQFSSWIKGVSRELEKKLLDNNAGSDDNSVSHEKLFRGDNKYDFLDLEIDKKIVNFGLIDGKQFAIEEDRQISSEPRFSHEFLAVIKFAKPAIRSDKALVYAEEKAVFPGQDSYGQGRGYGIFFKQQKGTWRLIKLVEMWAGGASFSASRPESVR